MKISQKMFLFFQNRSLEISIEKKYWKKNNRYFRKNDIYLNGKNICLVNMLHRNENLVENLKKQRKEFDDERIASKCAILF